MRLAIFAGLAAAPSALADPWELLNMPRIDSSKAHGMTVLLSNPPEDWPASLAFKAQAGVAAPSIRNCYESERICKFAQKGEGQKR